MSLALVWTCDVPGCTATASKSIAEPRVFATPDGWTYHQHGAGWRHRCPAHDAPSGRVEREGRRR